MKRYFQISCHALIMTAFLSLALTGRLDIPSILLFTIGVSGSLYRTVKGLPPLLSARGAFVLSCVYIGFFLLDSVVVSRSFISATIHLVLFLELAKLYQRKTYRDYLYLIMLAFLKVLAASSLTIDMSFVATLLLFLIALVATLMSFDMYRWERKTSVECELVAAPLTGMSVWATIWIILTGSVMFFLIPRVGTGYFSRAATESLLMSGFTENVQLGDIGQVKQSSAVVMHAKRIRGPAFDTLRWRGIALDRFDGANWRRSDRRRDRVGPSAENIFAIKPLSGKGEQVAYEILLEPLATTALFAPFEIRTVSGRLQGIEVDNDESFYMRVQSLQRIPYQILSEAPSREQIGMDFRSEEPVPPHIADKYLQLPPDLDPRVAELAQEIAASADTPIQQATLVEAYLKKNYRYTLTLDWTPGEQPMTTFLFNSKSGHCEYFASSMAILLRTIGIPTRLVNGFLMGEYNPIGDAYVVRQSDAHSWVEVFIPGVGWMEFDPTPPDANPELTLATQLRHYVDAARLFWNSYILIYDSGSQGQLFRSAQDRVQTLQSSLRDHVDSWGTWTQSMSDSFASLLRAQVETARFWILAAAAILAALVYRNRSFLRMEYRIWKLRKGAGAVDDEIIERMFYRAARLAERKGPSRNSSQTWREWTAGLSDPARRTLLGRAVTVFERSRYGRQTPSAADFALLEQTIRELRGT